MAFGPHPDEHLQRHPDQRLRLSLGLRKAAGQWVVAHEHHSFTDRTYEEGAA